MESSKNKNYGILIIVLLFVAWQLQAQTDTEKELLQIEQEVASGKLSDEDIFDCYYTLIWDYAFVDFEKTKHYFKEAIAFARKKKNVEKESGYLSTIANLYIELRILDSVPIYLDKALKLIEGKNLYGTEWSNHHVRGCFFHCINNYENAMEAYLNSLKSNEKDKELQIANKQSIMRNLYREILSLNGIAHIYAQLGNTNKEIEYLLRIKKIIEDNPSYDLIGSEYRVLLDLANAYMNIGNYESVLSLIDKTYKLATANDDPVTMVNCMTDYAEYYGYYGDNKRANDYLKQALQLSEKINHPYLIYNSESLLAKSYLILHDYKTALHYAESALSKISEDNWLDLADVYIYTSIVYAAMGSIEQSLNYSGKYQKLMSKISDENLQNALQEMEVKYEVEQKEQAHQAELKRQQTLRYILVGGLLTAGLLIALLIYIVMLRNNRNRELTEMNATKDKFFRIISHDLRNPAISQRDALQLLLENSEEWDTESLSKYYNELLKSANSQVVLLENLLNWSQLQSKRMPYYPSAFNLTIALQSDIDLVKNMAEQKGITFNVQIPEKAIVTGDDNMLAIVIRNLLTNAVKFTDTGGTVTLDITYTGKQAVSLHRKSDIGYRISISDTGTGITPDQLQNLFRNDIRYSKLGTKGEQGSGLGLLVCKELIEKHGSTFQIESEEGKGSRFWFEI